MIDHNPYRGVNAHLNSFLQLEGWESFHSAFIAQLSNSLDTMLPPNYYVLTKENYVDDDLTINSSIIYQIDGSRFPGKPVTRLELLSSLNKPGGENHAAYLTQHAYTIHSGLNLVEIDLLHESPPLLQSIPSYLKREKHAYPYAILVTKPSLTSNDGHISVYSFRIEEPLPTIYVPLADDDVIAVDFDAVYNRTFESRRVFRMVIDYHLEPARFQTYSPEDQERIRAKMAAIDGQS